MLSPRVVKKAVRKKWKIKATWDKLAFAKMMNSRLKTQIQSAFKLRGFQIRLDAVKYLSETLGSALQDENETEVGPH